MNKEFTRMQKLAGIITEGFMGQFYAPEYLDQKYGKGMASKIHHEIDEMDENSWDRFTEFTSAEEVEDYISDIKDMLGLTEGYQGSPHGSSEDMALDMVKTGAGLSGGLPEVSSNKMTVKEFKNKIKEAILAEKALKEDIDLDSADLGGDNAATDQAYAVMDSMDEARYDSDGLTNAVSVANEYLRTAYDLGTSGREFNSDLGENLLADLYDFSDEISNHSLNEAKKKKEEEEDVDIDLGTDGENIDLNLDGEESMDDTQVDMNMDTAGDIDAGSSESKKAFSELTDAYRAAKELGDEKLIRQIANTITYFNKNIILSQG